MEGFSPKEVKRLGRKLQSDMKAYELQKVEFTESFETNPNYAFQWKASRVMLAQARYELALELLPGHTAASYEDEHLADDHELVVKLAQNCFKWRDRNLDSLGNLARFESRSTSAMTNLVEDATVYATLELLERVREL